MVSPAGRLVGEVGTCRELGPAADLGVDFGAGLPDQAQGVRAEDEVPGRDGGVECGEQRGAGLGGVTELPSAVTEAVLPDRVEQLAERAQVYLDDANPYRPLLDQMGPFRSAPISSEEVAVAVAETIGAGGKAPFRIPVGEPAASALAARKAAPEDQPFLPAALDW